MTPYHLAILAAVAALTTMGFDVASRYVETGDVRTHEIACRVR